MEDPMSDVSTMAKMATFVQNADEMAQAYMDLYGKEWTTDELAVADASGIAPENAGYLWLKKLAYNDVVVLDDGDMVDAAFAGLELPEGEEPGFGWTGYSSVRSYPRRRIEHGSLFWYGTGHGRLQDQLPCYRQQCPTPQCSQTLHPFYSLGSRFCSLERDWYLPGG